MTALSFANGTSTPPPASLARCACCVCCARCDRFAAGLLEGPPAGQALPHLSPVCHRLGALQASADRQPEPSLRVAAGWPTAGRQLADSSCRCRVTVCGPPSPCLAWSPTPPLLRPSAPFPLGPWCRQMAAGDRLRVIYDGLAKDPNSLANLDQDLPNYAQVRRVAGRVWEGLKRGTGGRRQEAAQRDGGRWLQAAAACTEASSGGSSLDMLWPAPPASRCCSTACPSSACPGSGCGVRRGAAASPARR